MHPAPSAWLSRVWHLPVDAAAHGPATDAHLLLNLWIVLALAVACNAWLAAALISRRRSAPRRHSLLIEILPLFAFAALFAILALRADALWKAHGYAGRDGTAMQVEVVGEQFAWYVRYPGADATFGRTNPDFVSAAEGNPLGLDAADPHATDDIVRSQLTLPVGRAVDVRLRALDVIHGFSVPALRLKANAVPGSVTHLHFTATTPGEYAILCTQLCGTGHYRMAATLRVLPPAEFDRWMDSQAAAQAAAHSEAIGARRTP